jgi:VWFA-related protein
MVAFEDVVNRFGTIRLAWKVRSMAVRRGWSWLAIGGLAAFLIAVGVLPVAPGTVAAADGEATPPPAARIDLAALGYGGLSAAARQSGGANLSVDFLDSNHLLVTFNPKKLFKRLPECPPSHADRLVHAMVIAVPGGAVVKESDWYLHDSRRYVWRLGDGRVLLRRMNKLYEVDSNLEEKLIFESPQELLWVSVTPDGKQIVVETGSPAPPAQANSKAGDAKNDAKNKERVKISFLDTKTLTVQRTVDARGMTRLEATSSGFADVRKQGSNWLVEFGNTNITRVKARRVPNLLYTSNNTVLVGRCSVSHEGYNVSAFTVAGTFLWRQRWADCRYSPVVRGSEDGSRFAAGTVTIRPATAGPPTAPADDSQDEGLDQHVQVFDTATGKVLLSLIAEPAVPDGQNFSLSPEGARLAVVNGTTMDVYELAEMLTGDRARFMAVKAEAPALSVPPAQPGKEGEPVFESSTAFDSAESAVETAKAAASTPEVSAQKPEVKEEMLPTFTIRTGTQVVALDVVVTDSDGHQVRGLQQSDFSVSEDGKPQRVRYFKEFADAQRESAPPALPPREALPPNVFSNYALPPENEAVTVVMLDLLNTPITDQIRAQDELVAFLKKKPKNTKIAVCVLGNQLQMIQGFTDDEGALVAAAKGKKASQRLRPLENLDAQFDIGLRAGRQSSRFAGQLQFLGEAVAQQQSELRLIDADKRMFITMDAFAHMARYLDGIPGRKNLVWLSGSFLLGIFPESNGANPFLENGYYVENLKKVANLLGDAHVAVYPVSVKGLETNPLFAASSNDGLAPVVMTGPPPNPGFGKRVPGSSVANAVMMDRMDEFNLTLNDEHATMTKLAAQTGGQAFFNTNDLSGAIKAATEQGANYYALSYTPINKNYNGGYRKLKVTLAGKKYHLAYRTGYYAIDPFAPLKPSKDLTSSLARAAMQQGSPQSRQIVFGARVVPLGKPRVVQEAASAKPAKKRKHEEGPVEMQRYGIDHAVVFSDLRFNPTPEGKYHGVVNFMVTAFDSEGKQVASQLSQTVADIKPEQMKDLMAGGVRVHQEIDVPVNGTAMRLGVEDVSNSHVGTMEIRLPVPAPPEGLVGERRALPPVEPD